MYMIMCVLGDKSWNTIYIGRDPNKMWKGENMQMKKGKRQGQGTSWEVCWG